MCLYGRYCEGKANKIDTLNRVFFKGEGSEIAMCHIRDCD